MNTQNIQNLSRKKSMKALVVLATAGLALAVAAPGFAEPNTGSAPAKKGCEIQLKGPGAGQSVVYQDGYKFSVKAQDGKTHTYTCNDGKWEETVSIVAGGGLVWNNFTILSTAGTLQAIQLSR